MTDRRAERKTGREPRPPIDPFLQAMSERPDYRATRSSPSHGVFEAMSERPDYRAVRSSRHTVSYPGVMMVGMERALVAVDKNDNFQ